MNELPDTLPREYIIKAIHAYDSGFSHRFKEARLYELEFQGRRYPSKAIAGIAATTALMLAAENSVLIWRDLLL